MKEISLDKNNKFAYVTFLMRNDSFLPGALVLAYKLKMMQTPYDLVCMITKDITKAVAALKQLYDKVILVDELYASHTFSKGRQDRSYLFTRYQALRLGKDGDLGQKYEKIVLVDADVMPICEFDNLFLLDTPAGIINEKKQHCIGNLKGEKWIWHDIYEKVCNHGALIPKYITDRVISDNSNMGVNACLWVLTPNMSDYIGLMKKVLELTILHQISSYKWPEMQVATMFYSGRWHNVDLKYCSFNGHPDLKYLYGTHFAGLKPWNEHQLQSVKHYFKYEDYRLWYGEFIQMMYRYSYLMEVPKLKRLVSTYYILKKDRDQA